MLGVWFSNNAASGSGESGHGSAFTDGLAVLSIDIAIKIFEIGQIVDRIIQQRLRDIDATEEASGGNQSATTQHLPAVDGVGWRLGAELHSVFENLQKTTHKVAAVFPVHGLNINDFAIAGDAEPLSGKREFVGGCFA